MMGGGGPPGGHFPGPLAALAMTIGGIVAVAITTALVMGLFGTEPTVASMGIGEAIGLVAGEQEEVLIPHQAGDAERRNPPLARAGDVARTAQPQVLLGDLEAVGRPPHDLQAPAGGLGHRALGPAHQEAGRLLGSAADAAAQLVEL